MKSQRLASLMMVSVASAAILGPRTVSAQMVSATTQLNSRAWLKNECATVSCIRSLVQHNVALTFVPVGSTADLFARAEAFVTSTNVSDFMGDCAACEDNDRPFVMPPGFVFKLALGSGLAGGNGKSQLNQSGEDSDDGGRVGASNISVMVPTNGGVGGGTNSATAAGNAASPALPAAAPVQVTANPEPATIALMATGLVGLVPVIRRRRRSR